MTFEMSAERAWALALGHKTVLEECQARQRKKKVMQTVKTHKRGFVDAIAVT